MPEAAAKRIVICADGTWNDPEDKNPTNVLRVARAIKPVADDGFKQVVFYDWGVGSYYAKLRGGMVGLGIMKNIQDGYRFIVQNYNEGDKIFLFGFSRGAYTIRCLNGLLNNCGILRRPRANLIPVAFKMYKKRSAPPSSEEAGNWRQQYAYGRPRSIVEFIGVWDTVGSLGVPTRVLAFMDEKDLFYDHELGSNVKVARHAVSIDEQREDFAPTLWTHKEAIDIRQVWFAGVHADVGGGYAPKPQGSLLSDIPLSWMASQASEAGLQFESHLLAGSLLDSEAPLHKSHKGFWKVLGKRVRQIPTESVMHISVRERYQARNYRPQALEDWLRARNGSWGQLETA